MPMQQPEQRLNNKGLPIEIWSIILRELTAMSFLSQPLQTVFIQPKRVIGSATQTIAVQVVVNEIAVDTLTVTKQPVQQGAFIMIMHIWNLFHFRIRFILQRRDLKIFSAAVMVSNRFINNCWRFRHWPLNSQLSLQSGLMRAC